MSDQPQNDKAHKVNTIYKNASSSDQLSLFEHAEQVSKVAEKEADAYQTKTDTEPTEKREGYKLTKLGWIPEDWEVCTIGRSLRIENKKRKPINEEERKLMQGIYPYYGPTKIQDYINEYQYEGEYALIAEDGDHFLKYQDQPMTQFVTGKFNVNNHAHVIKGTKKCSVKWFYWFFNRRSIFSHLTRQGAGRYKLNKAALSQLSIAFPDIEEQKTITSLLDTWDQAIHTLTQLIQQKKLQKKGLMQQLLTGKQRLPGFDGEWKTIQIGKFAKEVSKKNSSNKDIIVLSCTKYDGLVPSLEYFGRKIYSSNLHAYKIVPNSHFVYATNHIEEGSIGYQRKYEEGLISPMYTVFLTDDSVDDDFLFRLLKSHKLIHEYNKRMEGSIDRRGGLRWKIFSKIRISLPPKKEQTAIAKVLQSADQEIDILKQKLTALKEQKKGMMQQLLTGKKRLSIQTQ